MDVTRNFSDLLVFQSSCNRHVSRHATVYITNLLRKTLINLHSLKRAANVEYYKRNFGDEAKQTPSIG